MASESLGIAPIDDAILLSWDEPAEPNGILTQYEVYSVIVNIFLDLCCCSKLRV